MKYSTKNCTEDQKEFKFTLTNISGILTYWLVYKVSHLIRGDIEML